MSVSDVMWYVEAKVMNVAMDRIMNGFTDEMVDYKSRYAWKYAASRGITGTPQFIVNGVNAPELSGYTKEQWEQFISKLLSSPY